jgi:hypothetical protein
VAGRADVGSVRAVIASRLVRMFVYSMVGLGLERSISGQNKDLEEESCWLYLGARTSH